MDYARIENGMVVEIIPAIDPAFPNIPIERRFQKSIVEQLVEIPADVPVEQYWTYTEETGFIAPPEPIEAEENI